MPPCTDVLRNPKLKILDEKLISGLNFNIFDPQHSHDQRHVAEFKIMPTVFAIFVSSNSIRSY